MSGWGKASYSRALDKKLRRAGLAARGLDEAMIAWSGLEGTDGIVTAEDVTLVAMMHGCPQGVDDLVEILVLVGRWEPFEGGYELHDWQQFNQTASKRSATSLARAQAGAKGGATAQARARAQRTGAPPQANTPNRAHLQAVPPPPGRPTGEANARSPGKADEELELQLSSSSDSHREPPLPETVAPPGYPLVGRRLDEALGGLEPHDPR